jgi:hypothetical protein
MTSRDVWLVVCGVATLAAGFGLWHGLWGPDGTGVDGFETSTLLFITLALVSVGALGLAALGGIVSPATSPLALIASSILVAAAVLLEVWIGPYVIPGAVLAVVAAVGWNVALAGEAARLADERERTGRR